MRISVSDLDSYRYYRDNEDASLEDLLRRLRREEPPSEAMLAGKALHAILEHADVGDLDAAERDGFKFLFDVDCEIALPRIRELKGDIQLQTKHGEVTLVGVIDAMENGVHDYKLTAKFDAERYADSYQWRCYLHMFGAHKFVYDVFVGKEDRPKAWVIYDFHQLPLYSYPGMDEDVLREVEEFAGFVATYLPERKVA